MQVLFLTFANSHDRPLRFLNEEDDEIYCTLSPRALKLHYLLHRDSYATLDKIARDLSVFRDYITLFHFSGHAGESMLLTEEGEAQGFGIAHLLGQCRQLKLVVLNGCSTKGQVQRLLDAGIPAVIATSASVQDEKAAKFSIRLYQALEQGMTFGEAFEQAKGTVLAMDSTLKINREMRHMAPGTGEEEVWGLYVQESKKEVLDDKLEDHTIVPQPQHYVPNERLTAALWDALSRYSDEITELKTKTKNGFTPSEARKRMAILNSLPSPVAEHLRKMLAPTSDENHGCDKITNARLAQIIRTYLMTLRLLNFTMLAQLWELYDPQNPFSIPNITLLKLRQFLHLTFKNAEQFDYIQFSRELRLLLESLGKNCFVDEIPKLRVAFQTNEDFRAALIFLEYLREKVQSKNIHPYDVPQLCIRAEESLAAFFSEVGFLARYVLTSVQSIDIAKYRHLPVASYHHKVVQLRDLLGGLDAGDIELSYSTDNRSVLLQKTDTMGNLCFMNLSPFVIDENAFEKNADVCKIHFFSHFDVASGDYCFQFVNRPEDPLLRVSATAFPIVKPQLDAFIELLNKARSTS